jgi:carboxylesterase type B
MRRSLLLVALAVVAAAAVVHAQLVIPTQEGDIQGAYTQWSGVTARAWLGIPYAQVRPTTTNRELARGTTDTAAISRGCLELVRHSVLTRLLLLLRSLPQAPVGDLRFQAPLAATPWEGTLNTTVAGAGCQQQCSLPPGLCPPVLSEDCLFLNVYAPVTPASGRAVMVFIHGGNFRQGSGSTGMYDGTVFVNTSEVVLVTMNYRLGALGFFFNGNSTANNGMLDQQLALMWVQKNIEAFGGNPDQVTIFGQSAGGTSVGCHLQNEVSLGLFDQAIIESLPLGIPVRLPSEAEALNVLFAKALNCAIDDLTCLQAASVDDIFVAQKTAAAGLGPDWHHLLEIAQPWQPTLQMESFPVALPLTQFFQVYPGKVPLMMGTTSQEAYVFIYEAINSTMNIIKAAAIEAVVFGLGHVGGLESFWPLHALADNRPPLSDVAGDELFLCAARNASDGIVASSSNTPIYLYIFDHVSSDGSHGWGPNYQICWTHVCHGSEVPCKCTH